MPTSLIECSNFIEGRWVPGQGATTPVLSPYTGQAIGQLRQSSQADVDRAVTTAQRAQLLWADTPLKERTQILFRFRENLLRDLKPLGQRISSECGKLPAESEAGLLKGIEVLEYALSLQNLDHGAKMQVSRGVACEVRREALGVVAGITPFNFPAMVPMWMIPIAIAVGNAFIWKPSDKTPLTSLLLAEAFQKAGLPDGVLTIVQGGRATVEALCDHPGIQAVGFVGSSAVARSVYTRATAHGKRALALGGAKNHIILMPDADPEVASQGMVASFTGCAGQRCMAASVALAVGDVDAIIAETALKAQNIKPGIDMGAIISRESLERLHAAIDRAQAQGAKILVDGRGARPPQAYTGGYWLGPTILDHVSPTSEAGCEELFGPVLSIVRCKNLSEALAIENKNPYGNAASVFTQSGAVADEVALRARAGMIGVNIGVPVPREPFSFGGFNLSRFGHGDITGQGGVEFWSNLKKVTSKWALQKDQTWMG